MVRDCQNRRDFIRNSLGCAAGLTIGGLLPQVLRAAQSSATRPSGKQPNVVVIVADDMGYSDVGCYGSEIQTPNLDVLARGGLRFTQFYNCARCWPSRASILTGYYPQQVRRDDLPGAQLHNQNRPAWARLLPEYLRPFGYRSYHSGKWHVDGPPTRGGFDLSFEYSDSDRHFLSSQSSSTKSDEGKYASTAIADQAIEQLKEHVANHSDRPFFQYMCFTEPHFPVQAPQKDIDLYRDRYRDGWDALRLQRWKRMTDMGIINCPLSRLDTDIVGKGFNFLTEEQLSKQIGPGQVSRAIPWKELTDEQQQFQPIKMAIHAAMVHRMDIEIGRVIAQLKTMGAFDDTIIFFLSDNGASAEQMIRGDKHDKTLPLGSAGSFVCIGPGWSSAANTPFRLHKIWTHEGGISTPLIVHWPKGIAARGELRHDPTHLIDLAPTILEMAGGKWPADNLGPPPPGQSLVPSFRKDGAVRHDYLWWYHKGNGAIRVEDWKLVAAGTSSWELYDLSTDRSEAHNLAATHPDRVKEMEKEWTRRTEEFKTVAMQDLSPGKEQLRVPVKK